MPSFNIVQILGPGLFSGLFFCLVGFPGDRALVEHTAVSVEFGIELHDEIAYVQIALDLAGFLERKHFLHKDMALKIAVDIHIGAYHIALDTGLLAYHHLAGRNELALEITIQTDVIRRIDLTLD